MAWFRKSKTTAKRQDALKEEVWIQCPSCNAHLYKEEWTRSYRVCSRCHFHDRLTAAERIELLLDPKSFRELATTVKAADPLSFSDAKGSYAEKAEETSRKTGLNEAVVTGHGKIHGIRLALSVMDFRFLGGSLGSGAGEKIFLGARYAVRHHLPYLVVSASGGARMHEGIISLMQMAKTCAAIGELHRNHIPYISLMTDPTTGGVSASYAMVGDINLAEPRALIGFAGRRVIEQTIKQKLPDEFQTAEYVMEHGFIDRVVHRKDLREELHSILQYCTGRKVSSSTSRE